MNNFFQHVVAITIAEQERDFAGIVVIDWLVKLLDSDFKFYLLIKYVRISKARAGTHKPVFIFINM